MSTLPFRNPSSFKAMALMALFILGYLNANCQQVELRVNPHQNEYNISQYKDSAKKIMKILHLKVRKNTDDDGTLLITVMPTLTGMDARFGWDPQYKIDSSNLANRSYQYPQITISWMLDSVLRGKTQAADLVILRAKSIFIHELTHYLQQTYVALNAEERNKIGERSRKEYVYLKDEKEGFAVAAYFFLSNYNPKELDDIMKKKVPLERKRELLINKYVHYVYTQWNLSAFN